MGFGIHSKPEDAEWIEAHLGLPETHMVKIATQRDYALDVGQARNIEPGDVITLQPFEREE